MKYNKIGVLFLAAILGLSIVGIPALYATNNDTCPTSKICNSTNIYKKTAIKVRLYDDSFRGSDMGYVDELHIRKGELIFFSITLFALNKGNWKVIGGGFVSYPVYFTIYNSNREKILCVKNSAGHGEYRQFVLPKLDKGNYTLDFVFNGSDKHKLLPCTYELPLYVH